jgi:hypothetical protein
VKAWILLVALWSDSDPVARHAWMQEYADLGNCQRAADRFAVERPDVQVVEVWCYPIEKGGK